MNSRVIDLVAGARPNFMKLASVVRAFRSGAASMDADRFSLRIVIWGT